MTTATIDTVTPDRFGKDHWSTFAYAETRCVDHDGRLDNRHMRTNARRHRALVGIVAGQIIDGSRYPTRLNDGEIAGHDDWDCINDLVTAGLLTVADETPTTPGKPFGTSTVTVALTDVGKEVAGLLRAHKADGHNFATFTWTPTAFDRARTKATHV